MNSPFSCQVCVHNTNLLIRFKYTTNFTTTTVSATTKLDTILTCSLLSHNYLIFYSFTIIAKPERIGKIVDNGSNRDSYTAQFWLSMTRDPNLDPRLGHITYHCASLIDLYLHNKFHSNQKNSLCMDGHTMDIGQRSRPANGCRNKYTTSNVLRVLIFSSYL